MPVVWLARAQSELATIRAYIAADNPSAAQRMGRRLIDATLALEKNPEMGRRGLFFDTREWVVYPYILIYRVRGADIQILRVIHGARRRP